MPLIDPGKKAPSFTLEDQDGKKHSLTDYAGQPLVIYFYPKDDTPGCTKESCAFQDNLPKFKKSKAAILGVSVLDTKSKARFASKYNLTFPLLADEGWLRTSLVPGLLQVARRNASRQVRSVAVFEVGTAFRRRDGHAEERPLAAFAMTGVADTGWTGGGRSFDLFDAKGVGEAFLGDLGVAWSPGGPAPRPRRRRNGRRRRDPWPGQLSQRRPRRFRHRPRRRHPALQPRRRRRRRRHGDQRGGPR